MQIFVAFLQRDYTVMVAAGAAAAAGRRFEMQYPLHLQRRGQLAADTIILRACECQGLGRPPYSNSLLHKADPELQVLQGQALRRADAHGPCP